MLVILPLLTFLLLFLSLLGLQNRRNDRLAGRRAALLQAAAFLGAYLLAFSEVLSLFHLLGRTWAAACWGLALVAIAGIGWATGLIPAGARRLVENLPKPGRFDLAAGALLAVILLLLCLTAVLAPSNNNDSLQYHMSRVMHWAENRSLDHYATSFEAQLYNPIWAETAILNLRLLWGNDRLANLVQWLSLAGILVAVSALAKILGAGRKGQWAAAAFACSLPVALLEATSTQNDLVAAFWLVGMVYWTMLSAKRNLFTDELIALAASAGLGLATKATFYPFVIPPLLYLIVIQFKRYKPLPVLAHGMLIAGIVLALNLGFWWRNVSAFGGILGPADLADHVILFRPGALAGSLARNVLLNLVTPRETINARIISGVQAAFRAVDPQMKNFNLIWGWNNDTLAGNPLHVLLVPVTLLLLVFFRKRLDGRSVWPFAALAAGLYVMLAAFVQSGVYDVRYQLPFFVVWAPLFGLAVESAGWKWLAPAAAVLLLIACLPWVFFNQSRPLIAMRNSSDRFTIPCLAGCTGGSVLNEPPVRILFAGWIDLQGPYTQATQAIRSSACRSVGLQLDSHDLEYTFWWLLDAPQDGMRLETIYTSPELQRYIDPAFKPCVIICTICKGRNRLHGLELAGDYSGKVQLYTGANYDPNPDK